jgi:hypothetical protein
MEVAEAIALARERAESMARLARILARIKPVITTTGTRLKMDDHQVDFYCATVPDATRLAEALPGKLELVYRGASTVLSGTIDIQGVDFNFSVQTVRQVRLDQCEVKRKKRPSSIGWMEARLFFHGLEIAKVNYLANQWKGNLRKKLWQVALQQKAGNERMAKYEFVL